MGASLRRVGRAGAIFLAVEIALIVSAFLAFATAAPSATVQSSGGVVVSGQGGGTVAPAATGALPRTGGNMLILLVVALALVTVGAFFTVFRRGGRVSS